MDDHSRRMRQKRAHRSYARGPKQTGRARHLRQAATEAEKIAWQLLRNLRSRGFVFRRQQPVATCIADFCCQQERLIIELDGSFHAQPSQSARVARRDIRIRHLGYRVERFSNGMVLNAPEEFISRILRLVADLRARRVTSDFAQT
jgi:very-short-patch-repair endonuclease